MTSPTTKELINTAITESLGWVKCKSAECEAGGGCAYWFAPDDDMTGRATSFCSNYYKDLNAIHKAVKKLDRVLRRKYLKHLKEVVGFNHHSYDGHELKMSEATAAQRCEAYLRAIDKWIDTPNPQPQ